MELDFTHDPDRRSWIESANTVGTDFPIQNLPFGVFQADGQVPRIGVAIGDSILDLHDCAVAGLLPNHATAAARQPLLNDLMAMDQTQRIELRQCVSRLLDADEGVNRDEVKKHIVGRSDVQLMMPCNVRDYSDFYASVHHATNVGTMMRPDNPLLPNYKHIPIGYHGRASSLVVSGTNVVRPVGQQAPATDGGQPTRGPSSMLDYEMEVGAFVAEGNELGSTIPIDRAEEKLFGMCLLNDWSARDLQKWEYQPLGPFLAKSFATTISPWIVTMEALAPFRCPEMQRPDGDPRALDYLTGDFNSKFGGVDIKLEVFLSSDTMRRAKLPPLRLSQAGFANMYWTVAQMLTHHASNGCNLQPGDLLGSGTVSGPHRSERGCLLELTWNGDANNPLPGSDRTPITLPTGEQRKFLLDGDEITFHGFCESGSHRRIGFGTCSGTIQPAVV